MFAFVGVLCLFFMISPLVGVYHLSVWNVVTDYYPRSWVSCFECGFVSSRMAESLFSYTYFTLLVFFVIFDLEVSLLLNMPSQGEMFKNFSFYLFFLLVLSVGFCSELYSGYVDWGY